MRATSFDQVGERHRARRVYPGFVLPAFLPRSFAASLPQFPFRKAPIGALVPGFSILIPVPSNVCGASLAAIAHAWPARRR